MCNLNSNNEITVSDKHIAVRIRYQLLHQNKNSVLVNWVFVLFEKQRLDKQQLTERREEI